MIKKVLDCWLTSKYSVNMHLQILEDYIAELAKLRIENRHEFIETSGVISRLMDIIIAEERRIPDFVVGGDRIISAQDILDDPFWYELWDDSEPDDISSLETTWLIEERQIDDPGFRCLEMDELTITISSETPQRWINMRRLKWTAMILIATVLGFVVGLMTAP